jgi:hypothetical protein
MKTHRLASCAEAQAGLTRAPPYSLTPFSKEGSFLHAIRQDSQLCLSNKEGPVDHPLQTAVEIKVPLLSQKERQAQAVVQKCTKPRT